MGYIIKLASIRSSNTRTMFVQVLLVLVHPHFGNTTIIAADEIADAGILERHVLATVDVSNARAWSINHPTVTLPYLKAVINHY
jgi:hypothetical protein